MPHLIIRQGKRVINEIVVGSEVTTIGRGGLGPTDRPDIALPDRTRQVSRYHAAIIVDQRGEYFVRDLGSANGTQINGRPCYRNRLSDGDAIGVGDFTLTYQVRAEDDLAGSPLLIIEDGAVSTPTFSGRSTMPAAIGRHGKVDLSSALTRDINDILNRLSVVQDLDTFCLELVQTVGEALGADRGFVAQVDSPSEIRIRHTFGIDRQRGDCFRITAQFVTDILHSQEAVVSKSKTREALGCALRNGPQPLEVIYLEKAGGTAFAGQEVSFLTAVSENLQEQVVRLSLPRTSDGDVSPFSEPVKWKSRLIGRSELIVKLFDDLSRCALADLDVLLLGETGTGKEVAARTLHSLSGRSQGPFVPVDVSRMESAHVEGELFGWRKGAFTGAISDRKGAFELADGGTLFLDEIGDISLDVQAKLRRAIEEKEINPLGSETTRKTDVRIVSATNVDLDLASDEGRFRLDLLKRLGRVIRLPRLNERLEDIGLLAHFFLDEFDLRAKALSNGAVRVLEQHEWTGNVRELRETIHGLATVDREMIFSWDLPSEVVDASRKVPEGRGRSMKEIEKNEILRVLLSNSWNVTEAARRLGYGSKQTLYNKMREYDIQRPTENN